MVLPLLAKGIMGASKVVSGAKMAKNMFKRKGGKDASDVPASEQIIDVKAETVRPTTPLVPTIGSIDATDISKPTSPTGTEDLEGTAFRIKTTLVDVDTLLKGSFALDKIREEERKKKEGKKKRKDQEKELENESKKNSKKFGLGKLVPKKAKGIFGNIINFFVTLLLGKILMSLLNNMGAFEKIVKVVGAIGNFIVEWGGKLFNALVSFIDFSYSIFDGLRGTVGDLFGEAGLKVFDSVTGAIKNVMNGVIALTLAMIAFSGQFGSSLMDWGTGFMSIFKRGLVRALPRLLIRILGKKTAGTILTKLGIKSVVTATTATTGTVAGTTVAGTTVAGGTTAGGGTLATVGGIGTGAAAGIVIGALGLATLIGEGGAQILKIGKHLENNALDASKKAQDTPWWNPLKYWHMATAGVLGVVNRLSGFTFGLFDILGTPFRLIIEAIRWPMMDRRQKDIAALNLEKFDARLREQFRGFFNFFDILGVVPDKPGSWGAMDWHSEKSGTDAMGYTEDGKPKDAKTLFSKESKEEVSDTKKGEVEGKTPPLPKTNKDEVTTPKKIDKIFKMRGKEYDLSKVMGGLSREEYDDLGTRDRRRLERRMTIWRGQNKKEWADNIKANSKSYEGLDKQAFYEEEGSTTTYLVSQKGSSSGEVETSSSTNAETVKLSEGLMLSNAGGGDSNNSYDVLAKR